MYINVSDPFSNENIRRLVRIYSDSYEFSFNRQVSTNDEVEEDNDTLYYSNSSSFYVYTFNLWKNSITSVDQKTYQRLLDADRVDKDFLLLQNYLRNIPDVKTKEEIYYVTHGGTDELYFLFLRYGYHPELRNGWNDFYSDQLTAHQFRHYQNEYSFVINPKSYDTTRFCELFIRKCLKEILPFYFKYNDSKHVSNKVVIYSDGKHLMDYLDVIRKIKEENPELIDRCGNPTLLYGVIDDWIGFGDIKNNYHDRYLLDRTNHINKAISEFTLDYIGKNPNKEMSVGNKSVELIDFITDRICRRFIENNRCLKERLKAIGLSTHIIKSRFFYNSLFRTVKRSLLEMLATGKIDNIDFKYNKSFITIEKVDINDVLRENTFAIFESNPDLYDRLKQYIIATGDNYDISSNYYLYNKPTNKNDEKTGVNK